MYTQKDVQKSVLSEHVLESAQQAVKEAGQIVLSFYQKNLMYHHKADGSYATQADHASEKYLIEVLKDLVPGAAIYAEESGITVGNEYAWVIDPLDGTSNFAHGIPYFCVTIALTHYEKPILALTYQPITKELFFAQKGCGAFLNGKQFFVSATDTLSQAYISTCFCYEDDDFNKRLKNIVKKGVSIRNFGAGALDIAYCAAGKLDACFFEGTFWWDIAAGSLLVSEAGGKVSSLSGNEVGPKDPTFIGGNELIFNELSTFLKK